MVSCVIVLVYLLLVLTMNGHDLFLSFSLGKASCEEEARSEKREANDIGGGGRGGTNERLQYVTGNLTAPLYSDQNLMAR